MEESVEAAILGGVTMVQLREKSLASRQFWQTALNLKEITTRHRISLIINDRLDIALAVDADGLHLGQGDLPLPVAKVLFPGKIIGLSVSRLSEALLAQKQGADYLGVGAVFPTPTKKDAAEVSLAELERIKKSVTIPVVAIGGIKKENLRQVMATGVDGAAVVSAVLAQENIHQAARQLLQEMDGRKF